MTLYGDYSACSWLPPSIRLANYWALCTSVLTAQPASQRNAGGTSVHYSLWLHEVEETVSFFLNLHLAPPFTILNWNHNPCYLVLTSYVRPTSTLTMDPGQRGRFSLRHQRHSVVGVLTVQRAQSDWLPALPPVSDRRPSDNRHVTLRKAWSEERPQSSGGESCAA